MKCIKTVFIAFLFLALSAGALHAEGVFRQTLGEYSVICINEDGMTLGDAILKTPATANPAELQKTPKWNQGGLNYFVVDAGARKMLFDAGNPGGNTPKMLAKAGIAPDDIDIIFLTHMHPDHLGGLLDADGKKVFPKAKVYIAKEEAEYWGEPSRKGEWFDLARKTLAAYQADIALFEPNQSMDAVTAIPTPGHTPGHTSFRVTSGGQSLLIWGDILHTAIQFVDPEIYVTFDVDPKQAIETRKQILRRQAESGEPVAGAHILAPGIGAIQKAEKGYAFAPTAQ